MSEHELAKAERAAVQQERQQHADERVIAAAERQTHADERIVAEEERVVAQEERETAQEERETAQTERAYNAKERRMSRTDVAALAVEVGHLGMAVADLHDLILDSMVKSEEAITVAQKAPTKNRLYGLIGAVTGLAALLAAIGLTSAVNMRTATHELRKYSYESCLSRNTAAMESAAYLNQLNQAVVKAQAKGDVLANELGKMLVPKAVVLPNCGLFR